MFQIVQMVSLCFSVLAAAVAAVVLVRAFLVLDLVKKQAQKQGDMLLEGGEDG